MLLDCGAVLPDLSVPALFAVWGPIFRDLDGIRMAEEVHNVVKRSAQAAKETGTKIEEAINKTAQGVRISGKVAEACPLGKSE
jgi:hypothetical protein